MTVQTIYNNTISKLTPHFGEREAASICRIIFEDKFGLSTPDNEKEFSIEDNNELEEIIEKLLKGEPVQYLVGQSNFYGLTFKVNSSVLIPRPETEELVYLMTKVLPTKQLQKGIDIGTGSGCIPITLKHKINQWEIHASDISMTALETASQNATLNNTKIYIHQFDILDENQWPDLPVFDFIVSNPPYIPPSEKNLMPTSVVEHEPHLALFVPEEDALLFYKQITNFANRFLKKGGYLFFETNEFNAPEVGQILENNNFENVLLEKDMQGKLRMAYGRK